MEENLEDLKKQLAEIENLFGDAPEVEDINQEDYNSIFSEFGLDINQLSADMDAFQPTMPLQYSKSNEDAISPEYAYPTDSGFDLYSTEELIIGPFGRALAPTGLHFDIPDGYEIQVRSKSGLALKQGLMVLNSPGTPTLIDYYKKTCGGNKKFEVIEKVNNGEKGLAEIYNEILNEAQNDIVVFCHDDIEFDTNNWGEKLLKLFNKNPEFGMIGIAGTTDLVNGRWWSIKESMTGIVSHKHEGKKWTNNYSPDQGNKLKEVVVLDGLFFAVDKTKIVKIFDESFKGFHFYEIPFCFENYLNGVKLAVTTQIRVTHMSIGQTNQQWEENKIQFEEKYKNQLPVRLSNNRTLEEKMFFDIDKVGIGMTTYNAEHRIKQSAFTVPNSKQICLLVPQKIRQCNIY